MWKKPGWKSSRNSTRTSTDRTEQSNQRRRLMFVARKAREPLAVFLFPLRRLLISLQALTFDDAGFESALFLAFPGLHLFRRVEVEPLVLPDEPLEHHSLKDRSGPMGILTKFFSIHDPADVLVCKADPLRLLHNLKDLPFHNRQNS